MPLQHAFIHTIINKSMSSPIELLSDDDDGTMMTTESDDDGGFDNDDDVDDSMGEGGGQSFFALAFFSSPISSWRVDLLSALGCSWVRSMR